MFIGYSDTGKQSTTDKLRNALKECQENHNARPIAIEMNAEDRGDMREIDGIPLEIGGRLVAQRNMYWFKLATE